MKRTHISHVNFDVKHLHLWNQRMCPWRWPNRHTAHRGCDEWNKYDSQVYSRFVILKIMYINLVQCSFLVTHQFSCDEYWKICALVANTMFPILHSTIRSLSCSAPSYGQNQHSNNRIQTIYLSGSHNLPFHGLSHSFVVICGTFLRLLSCVNFKTETTSVYVYLLPSLVIYFVCRSPLSFFFFFFIIFLADTVWQFRHDGIHTFHPFRFPLM